VEIAALVCAAGFLEEPARSYALELADTWNARIEDWTYVTNTELAHGIGVEGYYVRISPPEVASSASIVGTRIAIKNRPPDNAERLTEQIVSPGFLELVRLGLRRAEDPRIRDSVQVLDTTLKVDTPNGPVWHRYTGDGYGETAGGEPFNGVTGIGRAWPLLTGERGQYALAAGEDVEPYLHAMSRMTSFGGMIPEQVWDAPDIPGRHLYIGKPTGSATPLVWAHAEFLKLLASVELGHSVDRPQPVWDRYRGEASAVPWHTWRFDQQSPTLPAGKILRLEVLAPAYARWSADHWRSSRDGYSRDTGLGIHVVDLATDGLAAGTTISFTFYWADEERWEDQNFTVEVVGDSA
jgi:glucoamylase